jgi:hypothetical protein
VQTDAGSQADGCIPSSGSMKRSARAIRFNRHPGARPTAERTGRPRTSHR